MDPSDEVRERRGKTKEGCSLSFSLRLDLDVYTFRIVPDVTKPSVGTNKRGNLQHCVHLQPLDGLLAAGAEHDAVVQAGDGACTAGQGRQRRRGAHPRHGVGHCGEIIPLIHSLAFTVIVRVIG